MADHTHTAPSGPDVNLSGLTAIAVRRPVAVTMIVLTVAVFGAISFKRLPRNLMPDIAYPSVTVRAEYPGASPLDVETRVSRRLEEVLSQVRGLRLITSISRAEMSDVILEFTWDTRMGLATMDVREKLEQVVLPDEVPKPTILRYDPTLDPIIQIGCFRTDVPPDGVESALMDLRVLAEEDIEKKLVQVPRVAAVKVRGGLEREFRVAVSENRLRDFGLDMELINRRLKEENLNQASGMLYDGDQSFVVRTVNEFRDAEEIRRIVLRREGTVPLRLRDVATVTLSFEEPDVITRINGHPCVKIEIYKEADANVVEVAEAVRKRIFGTPTDRQRLQEIEARERELITAKDRPEEEEAGAESGSDKKSQSGESGEGGDRSQARARPNFISATLPENVQLEVISDQSVFIENSLENVRRTAISGGLLAVFVLYLFLRNFWFTTAVGLSIPISVIATFIALHLFDVSLNMMSLGGIALGIGMLVDNSIVVLESIFRCREEGDDLDVAAIRGTREVASAVTASTLTTVSVFFPIVFVEGIAGQVFRDQALAVVLSLVASLLVALYFIPAVVCRDFTLTTKTAPATHGRFGSLSQSRQRFKAIKRGWSRGSVGRRAILLPVFGVGALIVAVVLSVRLVLEVARFLLLGGFFLLLRGAWSIRGWLLRFSRIGSGYLFRGWDRAFEVVRDGYERVVRVCLRRRATVLTGILIAVYVSWRFFGALGSELIPEVHQGEFTAEIRLPVGTRIEKSEEIIRPLEEAILQTSGKSGIRSLTTTVGVEKDDITDGDEGEHSAKMLVRLETTVDPLAAEIVVKRELRKFFSSEPYVSSHKFQNPVLFTFKTPIEVEVRGYNLNKLRAITRQVEDALRQIPALKDIKTNIASGFPEVHLRLDREMMTYYDLSVSSVGQLIRNKLEGNVPTYFTDGDRKIGIRVRLARDDRETLEQLLGLIVHPDASNPVRLADVAEVAESEGPAEIRRIGHRRAGVVSASLTGMDLGHVVEDVERAIRRIPRPIDFTIGFGGQKEEMDLAQSSLLRALVLAIFLVYVVLAIQFESLIQPFVIITAVPLALLGVSPVLWLLKVPISIVTFIGMIVLAGIVVNNAIVLVDRVNHLRARGLPVTEALVEAGKVRLRPILMTTMTTVLGLLPLTGIFSVLPGVEELFGTHEGAEIRAPLAVTVIAGLITSTVLTLVVVPVFYSILATRRPLTSEASSRGDADRPDDLSLEGGHA